MPLWANVLLLRLWANDSDSLLQNKPLILFVPPSVRSSEALHFKSHDWSTHGVDEVIRALIGQMNICSTALSADWILELEPMFVLSIGRKTCFKHGFNVGTSELFAYDNLMWMLDGC